ncbi:MAG: histidine kinase [Acidimicrobiales bacterium]|nr:MAG: histidine kinase [Acidimicrobiales bacterium]
MVSVRVEHILRSKGTQVVTVSPDATITDAAGLLGSHGVGALVVSGDGRHIDGIISERDIARALADHGARLGDMRVADLMSTQVHTCRKDDRVESLMQLMTQRRIRHVPVVDDAGELSGIVSIGDVVKLRLDELEEEARTLHDYIETGR